MFKPLPIAKTVARLDALPRSVSGFARDTLTLGWEERLRTRARRRSDSGFEFATTLPRGTVLRQDDCLLFDAQQVIVSIVELAEPMLVVRPSSPQEWGVFAYHIGNSHQPMMVVDDAIVCPDALGMDEILRYHRIPFDRHCRRFTPLGPVSDHQHQLAR